MVDKVVFYWSGVVPWVGQLSLASALARFPSAEVHLYLDQDEQFHSALPPSLDWLRDNRRFKVVNFSFQEMLSRQGFKPYRPSRDIRERLGNLAFQVFHNSSLRKHPGVASYLRPKFTTWHHNRVYGWSRTGMVAHSIQWGGVVYRDDLFKTVIEAEFPGQAIICSDLDVYYAAEFSAWPLDASFISRWGSEPWANNSVVYLHRERHELQRAFRRSLDSSLPASPWHFFSNEKCEVYGLKILSSDLFDPIWSKTSISRGDSDLFFQDTPSAAALVAEIKSQNLAVHWHNHWAYEPEPGSPFLRLLAELIA